MYPGAATAVADDDLFVKDTGLYCCFVVSPEIKQIQALILRMFLKMIRQQHIQKIVRLD